MKNPLIKEKLAILFKKPEKKMLITLIGAYGILLLGVWILHLAINESLDWELLLWFNPDSYIPVMDELMIMLTDFSFYFVGFALGIWFFGYTLYRMHSIPFQRIQNLMLIVALIGGGLIINLAFLLDYTYWIIFLPFGILFFVTINWIGTTYQKYSDATLDQIARLIIAVLVSVALDLIAEGFMKPIVGRPRPLNSVNDAFNIGLRRIPDEIVRGGNSYFSGHSSGLFMLVTPFIWADPRRSRKLGLFLWGALHGFTRLYVAAHFPSDVVVGCLVGIAVGTIAIKLFFKETLQLQLRPKREMIPLEEPTLANTPK